jgi:polar amino acid transport system substrate-binding protein
MTRRPGRFLSAVIAIGLFTTACGGAGGVRTAGPSATPAAATPTAAAPTPTSATASASAGASVAPPTAAVTPPPATASPVAGDPNDLLALVKARGTIKMSTDPEYPPQSVLDPATQTIVGFDIDVGTEIAKRLGIGIEFVTPGWDAITAGSWVGRWDFSVGSMTITSARQKILDFTQPYYFTPAQMTARTDTGITTVDGLAGKTVCVGSSTTYFEWLNGTLDFGTQSPQTKPPAGVQAITQSTDRKCAEAWKRGRKDYEGWLSSSTTVEQAIKDGLPLVAVGDPVFYEPLAVAVDKSGPPHAEFLAAADKIVGDMHADGTLSAMSMKWFGIDLTQKTGQ